MTTDQLAQWVANDFLIEITRPGSVSLEEFWAIICIEAELWQLT